MPNPRFVPKSTETAYLLALLATALLGLIVGRNSYAQNDDPFAEPPITKPKPRPSATDDPFANPPPATGSAQPGTTPPPEMKPRSGRQPATPVDDPFGAAPPDLRSTTPRVPTLPKSTAPGEDPIPAPDDRDGTIRTRRPAAIPSSELWDFNQIDPRVFREVSDNTLGLTIEDNAPYFAILDFTRRVPLRDQAAAAAAFKEHRWRSDTRFQTRPEAEFPQFIDLFQNPDEYRGRPITLRGYLRRLVDMDPGENSHGLFTLYEGWMFTPDSQGNPAVVVFTDLPEGMPIGGDVEEDVLITGYFYKMYGYRAQDVNRRGPMILARSVHWIPRKKISAGGIPWESFVVVALGVLFVVYSVWLFHDYQRKMRGVRLQQLTQSASFDHLPQEDHAAPSSAGSVGPDDA